VGTGRPIAASAYPRRPPAIAPHGMEKGVRHRAGGVGPAPDRAAVPPDRGADQAGDPRRGPLRAQARGPQRGVLPLLEVPDDVRGRGGRGEGAARAQPGGRAPVQARGRPADHARRPLATTLQPRRAAAAPQRGAWRDEPGRAASVTLPREPALRALAGRAAVRTARHHRPMAGLPPRA
jgi:hypothetical protein